MRQVYQYVVLKRRGFMPIFRNALLATTARVAVLVSALAGTAAAQTWTPLVHQPGFYAAAAFVLTDGTIMVQDIGPNGSGSGNWYKLTPDNTGSYIDGTWTTLASMPSGYAPLYYASAVLPNGQLIVNGGEYNGGANGVWTTKGALYDPPTDSWAAVAPPAGWTTIGDAQSAVLPDGTYMLANCCTTDEATYNLATKAWTATGAGKADINDEEGWTLLPSGQLLTVDANNTSDLKHTEIMTAGSWASAGDTPRKLPNLTITGGGSHELGPQILRPDGTVLAIGATGFTAVYDIVNKTWSSGPTFPKSGNRTYDSADGPAALLPDGNVLLAVSPGVYKKPVEFFEIAGKKLIAAPATPKAAIDSSFYIRLLVLPNGQVLQTDGRKDIEIYTPSGNPLAKTAPKITKFPATVTPGDTYTLTGKYLNGWSQAVGYGDDYQAATNYPLVRITNTATGHVFYARTANHSSMAVANPAPVTTQVTIPSGIETGASTLVVVANGVASAPLSVTIE
jgi:hypothetical protein